MAFKSKRTQAENRRRRLLAVMADGRFHSGQTIAKGLRISRAGVWKLVQNLRAAGIDVQSVPKQGYRLAQKIDLLDRKSILESISVNEQRAIARLEIMLSVDSTNRYVREYSVTLPEGAHVCLAEIQTAGRGRRGRSWIAPFGSGICMSVGWRFAEAPPTFSALSLAVGVAVVRAFDRCGLPGIGLKWPNDLLWQGRKLGGILIEMHGESAGPAQVVIGIGINMRMPAAVRLQLAEHQAVIIADVHEILRERTPARNTLAAAVIEQLLAMLPIFAERGFGSFADTWRSLDVLAHTPVKILNGTETTLGVACGVDDEGALLVDVDGELKRFVSGEVSVRRQKAIGDRG